MPSTRHAASCFTANTQTFQELQFLPHSFCLHHFPRYSKEWEKTVQRLGRWIDFENDYKTLDPTFMESVWWVFKQLHSKGLVYQGFKVGPASLC